ncbi:MAG: VOC family protein [Candidatus Acidiferrales bacterium]
MNLLNRARILAASAALALPIACFAAPARAPRAARTLPARPPIVGISHVGLRTDDLAAARKFYGGVLGLGEPFSLDYPPGKLLLTYFKVNDHQYIEIFPELKDASEDRFSHLCFETTDAQALRDYLASRGWKVPDALPHMLDGNHGFEVQDPDGHTIEFVQYMPGSLHSNSFGKFMPDTRISTHIIHAGFTVRDSAAADRFYKDILGFREFWHGGMTDKHTDWIDMRVPDGTDWIEYMLVSGDITPKTRGILNHVSLGVPSVKAAYQTVVARGLHPDPPQIGRDGKWQLNTYDPNGTRVELMEPKPVRKPCCSPVTH